ARAKKGEIMKKLTEAFSPARMIIWVFVTAAFLSLWFPQDGRAMLAPPGLEQESRSGLNRQEDMQRVQRLLESKVVQEKLRNFGLTQEEINARLNLLPDSVLHQMASQIDEQMPGGGIGGLSLILIVLLIVILVVIFV